MPRVLDKHDKRATAAPDWRGILRPVAAAAAFTLQRVEPSHALAAFVERYWVVEWTLPIGVSHVQDVIGYPCVDLVFEPGAVAAWGPRSRQMRRTFSGRGRVLGVKFNPGGFRAFARCSALDLMERSLPAAAAMAGVDDHELESLAERVESSSSAAALIEAIERWLTSLQPDRTRLSTVMNDAVAAALRDPDLTTVADLAARVDVSVRCLQRLFRTHIGMSPKMVLSRFRLMAALHAADSSAMRPWSAIAADLGYADQAHLSRDFRQRIGVTPRGYRSDGLA